MIQTQFAHTIQMPDEWEAYVVEGINMHRLLKLVRPII